MASTPGRQQSFGPNTPLPPAMGLQNTDTVIGGYLVGMLVGHGGFGALYKVTRDTDPDSVYALKLSQRAIREQDPDDRDEFAQRAMRESGALANLDHPNIIRVRSFGTWPCDDGYPYLVTDFVDGHHLAGWRRYTRPSVMKMCAVLAKVAEALDYVHKAGIYHRDIKAENVLVRSEDGEPILIDFGISRGQFSKRMTRAGYTLGTRSHFSPEYVAFSTSRAFYDGEEFPWNAATDLYAVGVMAYELFTGTAPWSGVRDQFELDQQIQGVVPQLPSLRFPALPGAIDNIVMRLLAKRPEDRFPSGADLAAAIRRAMEDGRGVEAWEKPLDLPDAPPNDRPTGRPRRRLPSPAALDSAMEVGRAMAAAGGRAPVGASVPTTTDSFSAGATRLQSERPVAPAGFRDPNEASARARAGGPDHYEPGAEPSAVEDLAQAIPVGPPSEVSAAAPAAAPAAARPAQPSVAPPAVAPSPGAFREPTEVRARWTAIAQGAGRPDGRPVEPKGPTAGAPDPEAGGAPFFNTQIRMQAAQVSGAGASRRPGWMVVGGVAVALILLFFFVAARSGAPAREGRAADLLAEAEKHRREEAAREAQSPAQQVVARDVSPVAAAPTPVVTASVLPDMPPSPPAAGGAPATIPEEPPLPPPPTSAPAPVSVASPRPSGPRQPARPAEPEASPFQRSRPLVAKADTQAKKGLGVPLGSHIPVRLVSPLDSRTLNGAPVEAILPVAYMVDGVVAIPARTVFYGQGSAQGGRFTVRFTRARLPDNSEVEVEGVALDRADKKAGLVASRRITAEGPSGPGIGERIAKSAANTTIGTITGGGLGGAIAKDAGSQVVNQSDAGVGGGAQEAIMLDAPVNFTVFASRSF